MATHFKHREAPGRAGRGRGLHPGRLLRGAMFGLSLLALSGCYFEASRNLHSGQQSYTPSQFFKGVNRAFRAKDGEYIFLRTQGKSAVLTRSRLDKGASASSLTFHEVFRSPGQPRYVYVGVYPSSGKYQYYPFYHAKNGIGVIAPKEKVEITSLRQLDSHVKALFGDRKTYTMLPDAEAESAYRRHLAIQKEKREEAARKKKKQDKTGTKSHAPSGGSPGLSAGIDRLDVGDGVYWQGIFSDELVVVVRIDRASGKVKVRRTSDRTTAWVHHSNLITREQATRNSVGRGALALGLAYCAFNPQECSN